MSAQIPASRIPGYHTITLIAPQGAGKTLYSRALTVRLGCTHCIDGGQTMNGHPLEADADLITDGALILDTEGDGGDLTIVVHTPAGFHALLAALKIPETHRPPYSSSHEPGPGPDLQWDSSRSNTPSAISGVALSSNTD